MSHTKAAGTRAASPNRRADKGGDLQDGRRRWNGDASCRAWSSPERKKGEEARGKLERVDRDRDRDRKRFPSTSPSRKPEKREKQEKRDKSDKRDKHDSGSKKEQHRREDSVDRDRKAVSRRSPDLPALQAGAAVNGSGSRLLPGGSVTAATLLAAGHGATSSSVASGATSAISSASNADVATTSSFAGAARVGGHGATDPAAAAPAAVVLSSAASSTAAAPPAAGSAAVPMAGAESKPEVKTAETVRTEALDAFRSLAPLAPQGKENSKLDAHAEFKGSEIRFPISADTTLLELSKMYEKWFATQSGAMS